MEQQKMSSEKNLEIGMKMSNENLKNMPKYAG